MNEPEGVRGIFLSYRREDSAGHTGRLYDHLSAHFGTERVFMDYATIQYGEDFVDVISKKLGGCAVLVAVIGKQWLTSADARGRVRLHDPQDFVRLEILEVLRRDIPIVLVMIGGAAMPRAEDLPEALAPLARRQALELGDARFQQDVVSLTTVLERITGPIRTASEPRQAERTEAELTGHWTAEARADDTSFEIYLSLEVMGERVFGSVSYPTGDAGILDGRIEGDTLTFVTRHVPQFSTEEATIHWFGKISGGEIRGFSQSRAGRTRFTAKRSVNPHRYGWRTS